MVCWEMEIAGEKLDVLKHRNWPDDFSITIEGCDAVNRAKLTITSGTDKNREMVCLTMQRDELLDFCERIASQLRRDILNVEKERAGKEK